MIAIDDADTYGSQLSPLVRELVSDDNRNLVILGIRSKNRPRHKPEPTVG